MSTDAKFSFMNIYHEGKDLNYASELAGWNEHTSDYAHIVKERVDNGVDGIENTDDDNYKTSWDYSKYIVTGEGKKESVNSKIKNFKASDMRFTDNQYNNMLYGSTLSDPEDMLNNRFNKFSRYGYLDPTHELVTGTREYLFFSRPDLHLVETGEPYKMYSKLKNIPFFIEAFNRYKLSYYSLQQYFKGNAGTRDYGGVNIDFSNKFIPLLSNMVTSTFDLPDITATDVLNNQNLYQINTSYREGSIASDLQYDFTLEFKDTKYLDVYMLFKIYDEYFRAKYMEEIMPTRYDYIINKIYPEALSIWKVIVDDTGRIMYWAKATGCTPMSVPRGTISNIEGNIKFTVNWKAQFVKDMDPINLAELNYLTSRSMDISAYSSSITRAIAHWGEINTIADGKTWVGLPLVMTSDGKIFKGGSLRTGQNTNDKSVEFHRLLWVN